jgi:hypothetical protein
MSKEALTWANSQKIADRTLSDVLRAVAFLADKGKFECTKSQAEIAREVGASVRSIRYALAMLRQLEVIRCRPRSNGFSGRTTDAITLSAERHFDVSKAAVVAVRKALQPAKSAANGKSCNRQILPLQPAESAGEYNTVNTEESLSVGISSVGREGTYRGEEVQLPDREPSLDTNVVYLRSRGAL